MNAQDVERLRLSWLKAAETADQVAQELDASTDWFREACQDERDAYAAWQNARMVYAERARESVQDQRDNFIRRDRPTGAQDATSTWEADNAGSGDPS